MAEQNTQREESDDGSKVERELDEIIERDSEEDNSGSDSSIDGRANLRGRQNSKDKDETFPSATSDDNRLRKRKGRHISAQRDQSTSFDYGRWRQLTLLTPPAG